MDYQEYITSLEEQIQNKRAQKMIISEIKNHIEEQAEMYCSEGMAEDAALLEAVRQMGDPVETGAKLNRIHKPKFPIGLYFIVIILTFVGIFMQSIIFQQIDNIHIQKTYLQNTICYNMIGLLLILGLLYIDYTYIIRFAYVLYGIYFVLVVGCNLFMYNYSTGLVSNYFLWVLYPIIFAALLYRNKGKGMKGMVICYAMTLMIFGIKIVLPNGLSLICGGVFECMCIVFFIMFFAICKGIMGDKKRILYAVVLLIMFALPVLLFALGNFRGIAVYQIERLKVFFMQDSSPEILYGSGYIPFRLKESAGEFTLWGRHALSDSLPMNDMYSTFVIHSIFSWFGAVTGIVVTGLLLGFGCSSLFISLKQKNRIGMLLGVTCSLSILLRTVVYLLINFGLGIYYTTSIPFLAYGRSACIVNSIYVGIILCIYRNTNILGENTREWNFFKAKGGNVIHEDI